MVDISNKEIHEIKLTDLIELDVLQRIQEAFSEMSCMAALITDENGVTLTKGSNFSPLCMECRQSPEGKKRCEQCDKMGAISALDRKGPVYYYCHANLIDFAAPIMLKGRIIGTFIGGQVLANKANLKEMRRVAREIGVNEDTFVKAAEKTRIVPRSDIDRSTKFLYHYSKILSEMAYKTYVAQKMSDEALRAAEAKSDFLANMSHEIRTPLNAVIGMSQIALREEMSEPAKQCIQQIMSSGKILLSIINDILDYSKIEAGKMTLANNDYEILALIQDVVTIITNRIGDKNLELIIDVDPSFPQWLHGDDIRIKQIMINLANNAVKFTSKGFVSLKISYKWIAPDEILLQCAVQDTGIGIKKEAFDTLFNSFEQLDSKRNREIEGTGLGLAIVKNLVDMMHGTVSVESEYEKGSTFSFKIPQKVVDNHACIPPIEDCPCVIGLISNPYVKKELHKAVENMGAQYVEAGSASDVDALLRQTEAKFLFVSENLFSRELMQYALEQPGLTPVRIIPFNNDDYEEIPGIKTLKKPLYSMNVAALLRNVNIKVVSETDSAEIDFIAPDARILIVDDNEVNLTVSTGLLEPLKMKVDTAESAMCAIEKVSSQQYDIIFMDHMMPEVDGVEATHMIRDMYPAYRNIPIIALSANAVRGTREMFLQEGLDDFVAKPIELKILLAKVKKYLPPEKIRPYDADAADEQMPENDPDRERALGIPTLDAEYAFRLLGSAQLFWKVLKDYYRVIDNKYELIKTYAQQGNMEKYCIEVHALKSASRQIGAKLLADKAEQLEKASSQKDMAFVRGMTGDLLADYRQLQEVLTPYCSEETLSATEQISNDQLSSLLEEMYHALETFDLGATEDVLSKMKKFTYSETENAYLKRLEEAIEEIDMDGASLILQEWSDFIQCK